jgi:S1-C subfamily serine protease
MRFRIGGARVSNLSEELASRTELKPGFIITSVNDIRIKNAEEFYETIGNTDAESIVLEGFYPNRPYTYRYTVR